MPYLGLKAGEAGRALGIWIARTFYLANELPSSELASHLSHVSLKHSALGSIIMGEKSLDVSCKVHESNECKHLTTLRYKKTLCWYSYFQFFRLFSSASNPTGHTYLFFFYTVQLLQYLQPNFLTTCSVWVLNPTIMEQHVQAAPQGKAKQQLPVPVLAR